MQNEPIEVTLKVTGALEKIGVPYLIGGSLASALHGMVRSTQDQVFVFVKESPASAKFASPEDTG